MTAQRIKRVMAVHDLSGYGSCSLGVVFPVLSVCGHGVVAAQTAYLTAHTEFDRYTFFDLTDALEAAFSDWEALGLEPDAIYSGFLGGRAQIDLLSRMVSRTRCLFVLDPVMGDHGRPYATYTAAMCRSMVSLVPAADVVTPNVTEAALLLNAPYPGQNLSSDTARALCERLLALGCRAVVLKGLDRGEGVICNAIMTSEEGYVERFHPRAELSLCGTGDLFASLVVGLVLCGFGLSDAVDQAGCLVYEALLASADQPGHEVRGVSVEPILPQLMALVQRGVCCEDA